MSNEWSAIWMRQQVPAAVPGQQLLADATVVKRKAHRKLGLTVICLILTLIGINWIAHSLVTREVTTMIGVGLVNLAILFYLAASGDILFLWMKKMPVDLSVKDMLEEMILLKKRQSFLYGRLLGVYYILLFLGFMFYMWEFAGRMSVWGGVGAYACTAAWVGFSWFWIRPRTVRKYQGPMDMVIREMERVSGQLPGNS